MEKAKRKKVWNGTMELNEFDLRNKDLLNLFF